MDAISKYITQPIINVFKFHKFKVFFLMMSTMAFFVVMFPYGEISEIISAQINKATRNQVQVSFSDLRLSLIPFGISATDMYVLTPQLKTPLYIKKAHISPSILSFLSFKPGGSVKAEDFLGGDVTATLTNLGQGTSKNKNSKMVRLQLNFSRLQLSQTMEFFKIPAQLSGALSGKADIRLDTKAFEQPRGNFSLNGQKIGLPGSISLQGMDLILPEGELKRINVNGELQNGNLKFTEGVLGQPSDVIYGKIRGQMELSTRSVGSSFAFVPGSYNFNFDLNFDKQAEQKLGTMIGTILLNNKGGRSEALDGGARYIFSVSGYPRGMPNFQPLNQF